MPQSTMLTLVQTFCQRKGLPSPSSIAGSSDHQIIQLLALLNETLEDLVDRWDWADLQHEAVFTTVDGEDQGALTTLASADFLRIFNETIFNRSLRLPIFGPLRKEQWQALKALPTTGPFYKYRVRQGRLLFNPPGVAGQTCAFEYQSARCVILEGGSAVSAVRFLNNGDTCIFDDKIVLAGLSWKWLSTKGLDYAEEFRRYETLANNAAGRDASHPRVNMGEASNRMIPGIWVSPGNWPLNG